MGWGWSAGEGFYLRHVSGSSCSGMLRMLCVMSLRALPLLRVVNDD